MGRFLNGILIGVGIGLLVAPMRGDEMRRQLGQRLQNLQNSLPENSQLSSYTQQITDRLSQTGNTLKESARQAASEVQNSGSNLGNIAQQAGNEVKQTSQDVTDTTKQASRSTQRRNP